MGKLTVVGEEPMGRSHKALIRRWSRIDSVGVITTIRGITDGLGERKLLLLQFCTDCAQDAVYDLLGPFESFELFGVEL